MTAWPVNPDPFEADRHASARLLQAAANHGALLGTSFATAVDEYSALDT